MPSFQSSDLLLQCNVCRNLPLANCGLRLSLRSVCVSFGMSSTVVHIALFGGDVLRNRLGFRLLTWYSFLPCAVLQWKEFGHRRHCMLEAPSNYEGTLMGVREYNYGSLCFCCRSVKEWGSFQPRWWTSLPRCIAI